MGTNATQADGVAASNSGNLDIINNLVGSSRYVTSNQGSTATDFHIAGLIYAGDLA